MILEHLKRRLVMKAINENGKLVDIPATKKINEIDLSLARTTRLMQEVSEIGKKIEKLGEEFKSLCS